MATSPVLLPLERVLRLISAEIGSLTGFATAAGGALALALDTTRPVPPRCLGEAQSLDEMEQRIAGLRAYVDEIAHNAPRTMMLDVSEGLAMLPLAAQAERLSGRTATTVDRGSMELF